jgi:hypothetical protein
MADGRPVAQFLQKFEGRGITKLPNKSNGKIPLLAHDEGKGVIKLIVTAPNGGRPRGPYV